MATMASSSALNIPELNLHPAIVPAAASIPLRQQAKAVFVDMARNTWSSAKSLGKIAGIFGAFECTIESVTPPWKILINSCFFYSSACFLLLLLFAVV